MVWVVLIALVLSDAALGVLLRRYVHLSSVWRKEMGRHVAACERRLEKAELLLEGQAARLDAQWGVQVEHIKKQHDSPV